MFEAKFFPLTAVLSLCPGDTCLPDLPDLPVQRIYRCLPSSPRVNVFLHLFIELSAFPVYASPLTHSAFPLPQSQPRIHGTECVLHHVTQRVQAAQGPTGVFGCCHGSNQTAWLTLELFEQPSRRFETSVWVLVRWPYPHHVAVQPRVLCSRSAVIASPPYPCQAACPHVVCARLPVWWKYCADAYRA